MSFCRKILIVILISGFGSMSQNVIYSQNGNHAVCELKSDYMLFDNVFINCRIKLSNKYYELKLEFGNPDTIVEYNDVTSFYGSPYSYVKYKNMDFHLYENEQVVFNRISLTNSSSKICYKDIEFYDLTTLDEMEKVFPKSYLKKDMINLEGEELIAVRLFTAEKPTKDEFVLLFHNDKLKYFCYFDGND